MEERIYRQLLDLVRIPSVTGSFRTESWNGQTKAATIIFTRSRSVSGGLFPER